MKQAEKNPFPHNPYRELWEQLQIFSDKTVTEREAPKRVSRCLCRRKRRRLFYRLRLSLNSHPPRGGDVRVRAAIIYACLSI